jgi:hypothetical protein
MLVIMYYTLLYMSFYFVHRFSDGDAAAALRISQYDVCVTEYYIAMPTNTVRGVNE